MSFEPNVGQADSRARFVTRNRSYGVFLTDTGAMLSLPTSRPLAQEALSSPFSKSLDRASRQTESAGVNAIRMRFDGASPVARAVAENELPGVMNYLRGNDPEKWHHDVPTYSRVRFESIYEGIDAVFYGTQERLEYDVVVRPGVDASAVRVRFEGHDSIEVTPDGDLVLKTGCGELRHVRPSVFQSTAGEKRPVSATYRIDSDGAVRFAIGEYDRSQPLVIDPAIEWSRFLGGSDSYDEAVAVALDGSGNTAICGITNAWDFPTTPGAFSTIFPGSSQYESRAIFIMKISASGSDLLFSTYLDGSAIDVPTDIAVRPDGGVVVVGKTTSPDFPTTPTAFDTVPHLNGSCDAFVTRLNPTGTGLLGSTFLGGELNDVIEAVALDSDGSIYAAGSTESPDFPSTPSAFDPTFNDGVSSDAFLMKLNPVCSALSYATFLGGTHQDAGMSVAVRNGEAFVGGFTESVTSFPVTPGSFQTVPGGSVNGFISRVNASGSSLIYSTFLGGTGNQAIDTVAVTSDGSCIAAGQVDGLAGFPAVPGSYVSPAATEYEIFACRLDPDGEELTYSAIIGGNAADVITDMAADSIGNVYVVGKCQSTVFPFPSNSLDTEIGGPVDGLVAKLASDGATLEYASYVGGSASDWVSSCDVRPTGQLSVCGMTLSTDFATTASAVHPNFGGQVDGFLLRLDADATSIEYSTFLSGTRSSFPYGAEHSEEIQVDAGHSIFLAGFCSIASFPTTPGAYDTTFPNGVNSPNDLFVTKLTSDGSALQYSTYLGGSDGEELASVEVAADGTVVIAAISSSSDFPTTPGAYSDTYAGGSDGILAQLSPTGSSLVFGTYFGGAGEEFVTDTAIAPDGTLAVVGRTMSPEYPTTVGAYDTSYAGGFGDGFLSLFSKDGTGLIRSTFIGGAAGEIVNSVQYAGAEILVGGNTSSEGFPVTPGAYDQSICISSFLDGFVSKFNADCSSLVFSTFLGGCLHDVLVSLSVDSQGAIYAAGYTYSTDFPTTPGAFDESFGVSTDASPRDGFVSKLNSTGTALLASTFVGDTGLDELIGMDTDQIGRVAVVGYTSSSGFPISQDAFDSVLDASPDSIQGTDGFFMLLSADLSTRIYGTFLGTVGPDQGTGACFDPDGSVVITGESSTTAFLGGGFGRADDFNVFVMRFRTGNTRGSTTPAVYIGSSGAWFLRNSNSPGVADVTFSYGPGGAFAPVVGDWDGDGDDSAGIYDPTSGAYFLRNTNGNGVADLVFTFGAGGAGVLGLAGDWNGDGIDTIGLYVVGTGVFFLRNENSNGPADVVFSFDVGGAGMVPVVGDWNGDGVDTIGLYSTGTATFFLRNSNSSGAADLAFSYGPSGATPVTGDWQGDGTDTVGIYVPATGAWFLRNVNSPGNADVVFIYGPPNARPIVGNWDAK